MTLTKFGLPDWRPGMDPIGAAESPAQHRFPVWWTGDGVNLQASVQSMVDSGVHGLKPFVPTAHTVHALSTPSCTLLFAVRVHCV
jgi:hypothetical protein